jgi:hypothetical protein
MSPIRVAPEETQSSETDDPFYIPVATQARIYAALGITKKSFLNSDHV